jgi:4-amino-4-deoxychorismate lyase
MPATADEPLLVLINGSQELSLSVHDRGFLYGDGLFETIAFRKQKLELLDFHLERLSKGCKRLGIQYNCVQITQDLEKARNFLSARGLENAVVKLLLTRGKGQRGYSSAGCLTPTCIVYCDSWSAQPPSIYQSGVRIILCDTVISRSPVLAGLKHLNRLEQVMARSEWNDSTIFEGLLFDEFGSVIEGTFSNLFIVTKDAQLHTPDLQYSGVAGVLRRFLIERLAPSLQLPVFVSDLKWSDIALAQEIFLTNSLIGIVPVSSCGDISWPVGNITRSLIQGLQEALDD